jgi:hypothetical protein
VSKSNLSVLTPVRPAESLRASLVKLIADIDAGMSISHWFLVARGPHPDNPQEDERYRCFDSGMSGEQLLWALESAKWDLMSRAKA